MTLTIEEIISMARQISKTLDTSEEGYRLWTYEALQAFAKLVEAKAAEREREACAKVCYELMLRENPYERWEGMKWCMDRIRSRGEA